MSPETNLVLTIRAENDQKLKPVGSPNGFLHSRPVIRILLIQRSVHRKPDGIHIQAMTDGGERTPGERPELLSIAIEVGGLESDHRHFRSADEVWTAIGVHDTVAFDAIRSRRCGSDSRRHATGGERHTTEKQEESTTRHRQAQIRLALPKLRTSAPVG